MATIFILTILLVLHWVFCDSLSCILDLCKNWQSDSPPCVNFIGVYGDVVRVKILFNKKDTALIQFNYVQQAQTGNFSRLWVTEVLSKCSLLFLDIIYLHVHNFCTFSERMQESMQS